MKAILDSERVAGSKAIFETHYYDDTVPAVPVLTITAQVIDGDTVTISGTTTNITAGDGSTGYATLSPANPANGAAQQGPNDITFPADGQFSITFLSVPGGNYLAPTVTASNNGGSSAPATGGVAFSIMTVSGGGEVIGPLAGASTTQSASSSSGAITRTIGLIAANASQASAATAGSVAQIHASVGANALQGSGATAGSVSQVHVLIGGNAAQDSVSVSFVITADGELIGASSTQVNLSSSGSITQTTAPGFLVAESSQQDSQSIAGAIIQAYTLSGANSFQAGSAQQGTLFARFIPDLNRQHRVPGENRLHRVRTSTSTTN